jgi:HEAT repeat protein
MLVEESGAIVVLEVDRVLREDELIIFKPVAALAGEMVPGPIRHHAGGALLDWARPGNRAICFFQGGKAVTCVGNHWYYCWNFGEHAEPPVWSCADWVDGFAHSYVGPVDRLREHMTALLAGREVVVTAQAPEVSLSLASSADPIPRDWRRGQKGRVWRIKAGPKVTRPVHSEDSPFFVGWGVGGTEVVRALLRSLHSEDALVRAEALEDLGQLGPIARPALPALRQALRDVDPFVRLGAVSALARLNPETPRELAVILQALRAQDPDVRCVAVRTLVLLGPHAQPVIPDLIRLLRYEDTKAVREAVAFALGERAFAAPADANPTRDIAAALAGALDQAQDVEVRFEIVRALLKCGAQAWVAVPALSKALCDGQHDPAAVLAADLLTRLDPPAVEILAEALQDPDCGVRTEIAEHLTDLGSRAQAAAPALRRVFDREEDPAIALAAARALQRLAPRESVELSQRVRELKKAVRDDDEFFVGKLREGLRRESGPARSRLAPVLRRGKSADTAGQVWQKVGAGLSALLDRCTSAEQARRVFDWCNRGPPFHAEDSLELWEEDVAGFTAGTTELIRRLTATGDPVPVLVEAMQDRNLHVRVAAVMALARVEPHQSAIVPVLLHLLERRPSFFWVLADTLESLGSDARPTIPWLQQVLRNQDRAAYRVAADVLRRIDPQAAAQVWSAAGLRPDDRLAARWGEEDDLLWAGLALDPLAAYRATWTLAMDDGRAVRLLRERLRPVPAADSRRLARLIADLDSEDFRTRERAASDLGRLREAAELCLRQALAAPRSAEVRRRVEVLLERLAASSVERLREGRAVSVLEQINTADARRVLAGIAEGAAEAHLTQEARAARARLDRQPEPVP